MCAFCTAFAVFSACSRFCLRRHRVSPFRDCLDALAGRTHRICDVRWHLSYRALGLAAGRARPHGSRACRPQGGMRSSGTARRRLGFFVWCHAYFGTAAVSTLSANFVQFKTRRFPTGFYCFRYRSAVRCSRVEFLANISRSPGLWKSDIPFEVPGLGATGHGLVSRAHSHGRHDLRA